ncbi:hypothetical protein K474DRAFT_1776637 [Panus rudis PR-1116 ss-1]|nr:hypothetical protein K474DRAFT_1776637 [Panus rudis PR-1116 ss-1]
MVRVGTHLTAACFSPTVQSSLVNLWRAHTLSLLTNGGTVARTRQESSRAEYYFCAGKQDPWLPTLCKKPIVVFNADWIEKSVSARIALPKSEFILDSATISRKTGPEVAPLVGANARHPKGSIPALPIPENARIDEEARDPQQVVATPPRKRTRKSSLGDDLLVDSDIRPRKRRRQGLSDQTDEQLKSPLARKEMVVTSRQDQVMLPRKDLDPRRHALDPEHGPMQRSVRFTSFTTGLETKDIMKENRNARLPFKDLRHLPMKETHIEFKYQLLHPCRRASENTEASMEWDALLEKEQTAAPIPRINISDALYALRDVSLANCARFEPRREHLGKVFHCYHR